MKLNKLHSSFRDPSGFLFQTKNTLYRQINKIYQENFDHLIHSGLYQKLVDQNLLISHKEIPNHINIKNPKVYKVIQPTKIPFISYPYEWCFSQLKDAGLLTLKIQKLALQHKMTLKDASNFNLQFLEGRPIFIDTLSFEMYSQGKPWVAYRQFCEHFLAPLALMAHGDIRLGRLLQVYPDGLPLDLVSKLLPLRARLKPSLFLHLSLHAAAQKHFSKVIIKNTQRKMSLNSLFGLLDNLEETLRKLSWKPRDSHWGEYYEKRESYSLESFHHKSEIVRKLVAKIKPTTIWDLGGNIGSFSRSSTTPETLTICFDSDPVAIEKNYQIIKDRKETNILPLFLDLTNPTPGIGWSNKERDSLIERGPTNTIFALALIHHLAITHNIPLDYLATLFSKLCNFLIIEFIPKQDQKVVQLLSSREDIFVDYTEENFEKIFKALFLIREVIKIDDSFRKIYLMENKTRVYY